MEPDTYFHVILGQNQALNDVYGEDFVKESFRSAPKDPLFNTSTANDEGNGFECPHKPLTHPIYASPEYKNGGGLGP